MAPSSMVLRDSTCLMEKHNRTGDAHSLASAQIKLRSLLYLRCDLMPSLSYPLSYDCPYQYAKTATEDALVAAAQEGHEWAFMELYRRNSPRLMRALYRITKNREDAEDALQDCMLRAFIHLNRFDRRAKFSTWFTTHWDQFCTHDPAQEDGGSILYRWIIQCRVGNHGGK